MIDILLVINLKYFWNFREKLSDILVVVIKLSETFGILGEKVKEI